MVVSFIEKLLFRVKCVRSYCKPRRRRTHTSALLWRSMLATLSVVALLLARFFLFLDSSYDVTPSMYMAPFEMLPSTYKHTAKCPNQTEVLTWKYALIMTNGTNRFGIYYYYCNLVQAVSSGIVTMLYYLKYYLIIIITYYIKGSRQSNHVMHKQSCS